MLRKQCIAKTTMKVESDKFGENDEQNYSPLIVVSSSTIGAVTWACNCHVQPAATPRLNWAVRTGSAAGHQLSVNYMARWQWQHHHHHERAPASLFSATAAAAFEGIKPWHWDNLEPNYRPEGFWKTNLYKQKEKLLCLCLYVSYLALFIQLLTRKLTCLTLNVLNLLFYKKILLALGKKWNTILNRVTMCLNKLHHGQNLKIRFHSVWCHFSR